MPNFPGWLKRGKRPVDPQPGTYPEPPAWEMLRHLNGIKRKASPTPGKVKLNVEPVPLDIFRAHGDTVDTPEMLRQMLLTYSLLGGMSGDFNNPATLRPWPAKVSRQGAIHTLASGLTAVTPNEGNVDNSADITITLNPTPAKTLLIANDGTATVTAKITSVLKPDGHTPDFAGISACSFPAGFVTTMQIEAVGVLLHTASGVAQAYRVWALT